MPARRVLPLALALALAGCADRAVVDATDTEELPGEEQRPMGGTLYADCNEGAECNSGLCFFP